MIYEQQEFRKGQLKSRKISCQAGTQAIVNCPNLSAIERYWTLKKKIILEEQICRTISTDSR